ncbi:hypothetical protein [Nocardiopsis lambiniae]|uniref:Uncharacterized protein n=1 Tax=Nocardiopsis lambiniae TaxID=3075539 RepID=A0ABU2M5V5_9ACTN|nr:hypothetical protein [Nocardiopsis sp. DSM 44743]MDT0327381.1 hypothetical protein [Nocardiopsis sp. DSM 44743]
MARYRYLNRSEPVAARRPASEALRWRRPRSAARARTYVTRPARDMAPLTLVVRQWISQNTPPETPTPISPSLPVPRRVGGTGSTRPRAPEPRTGPEFSAALASRPRIQALREGTRSRTRPGSPTAASRAAARLRARTAAFRNTDHLIADRDGLWKDAMAAARILKWDLGRAA